MYDDLEAMRRELLGAAETPATKSQLPTTAAPVQRWRWSPIGLPYGTSPEWAPSDRIQRAKPPVLGYEQVLQTLRSYGVPAMSMESSPLVGSSVTTYIVRLEDGARVSSIGRKADDIAFGLGLPSLRVLTFMEGKPGCIGLEVPNMSRGTVVFRDIVAAAGPHMSKPGITIAYGAETNGRPYFLHLGDSSPHLLIAGKSGSGKSVAIDMVMASICCLYSPDDVQVAVVDPKTSLGIWKGMPHLIMPPVSETSAVASLFSWAASEIQDRKSRFDRRGCTTLSSYNSDVPEEDALPKVVIVVDEYETLMSSKFRSRSSGPSATEQMTADLLEVARLGRSYGMHLVLATQRPTAESMHPTLKSQTTKIACVVETVTDSRIILDMPGAEALLGRGDSLVKGSDGLARVQCAWISPTSVASLINGAP